MPDLLLQHHNGTFTVVDVKPERMLKGPTVIHALKWTDPVRRGRVAPSRRGQQAR